MIIWIVFGTFLTAASTATIAKDVKDVVTIYNGTDVPEGKANFMALLKSTTSTCGGAILNDRWILTSADCIQGVIEAKPEKVVVGTNHYKSGGQEYDIEKLIVHEDYNPDNAREHNLGLIKTTQPIVMSERVTTVKLPEAECKAGANLKVYGWFSGTLEADTLQMRNLTAISVPKCQEYNDKNPQGDAKIFDSQICTIPSEHKLPKPENCVLTMYDDGSLLIEGDNRLVGVMYFSNCCHCFNLPDIGTRVYFHLSWINKHIANNS